jgi:hydroxymethylpyrimidine pyrophosphatase-like HAD family hydrolase
VEVPDTEFLSPGQDEDSFFEPYAWCINPILSLREQFHRLQEELQRVVTTSSVRQKRESGVNVYLFVCSIACTVDDYLAWQFFIVSPLCARFPAFSWLLRAAGSLANSLAALFGRPGFNAALRWRRAWGAVVDRACALLIADADDVQWTTLASEMEPLLSARLPGALRSRRLRIPEAFRCQDLAHPDVFSLVDRFLELPIDRSAPAVVIGPRTAGAYLAPLAGACLSSAGWSDVNWFTVRPRTGVSRHETRTVARLVSRPGTHVILIDDFPNTGGTHQNLLRMLYGIGVPPRQITILAPRHPHRREWSLPEEIRDGIRILTIEPTELYKAKLLNNAAWIESVLSECYRQHGWDRVRVRESTRTRALNAALEAQLSEGFHVRLKRVFDLELEGMCGKSTVRVLAKSVGWGWYGYHAYIAGSRLSGFVPDVIGSREGFFFTRWVDAAGKNPSSTRIGSYVARRANVLALDEDPVLNSVGYRWVGWNEILEMVRGVYGPYWNRLRVPAIRRHLAKHLNAARTMVDGQMKPEDWVGTGDQAWKTDFEQHNFGGPEYDLVDPAYDLAGAIFEFRMSEDAEVSMLDAYAGQTGDYDVYNRITLFKALYAGVVLKRTADALSWEATQETMRRRESMNRRAREFLTTQLNRRSASIVGCRKQTWPWSNAVFFLDLDGVFYSTRLGFPHPTPRAVAALELLRSRGIAVVVNTARDVAHVREFCHTYGLPGGVAERGSVFVDAAGGRELPLVDPGPADQLARCREVLKAVDGIYLDDAYEFSVRACRILEGKRVGLGQHQTDRFLKDIGLDCLSVLDEGTHTDIAQRRTDKGTGVERVLGELGIGRERAAAIGNSDQDIPMLNACGFRYAPARCSKAVRRVTHLQSGLPYAARHFANFRGPLQLPHVPGDPLEPLLRVAERSLIVQLACLALFTSL